MDDKQGAKSGLSDLQVAIEFLKAGDKDSARKTLVRLVRQDPDNEKAWVCLVACAANRTQIEASIQQLLRLNPTEPKYHQLAERYQVPLPQALSEAEPSDQQATTHPQNVKEAIAHVNEVLNTTTPPQYVRPTQPAIETEEDHWVLPSIVRRLWFWVGLAVLIIAGIITTSTLNNEQNKRNESFTITAEAALVQGSQIAVTNAAIVVTVERSATRYWATETFYQATQQPIQVILQDMAALERQTFKRGETVYVTVDGTLPDLAIAARVSSNGVVLASQDTHTDTMPTQFVFENLSIGQLRLTIFLLGQPVVDVPLIVER